MRNLITFSSALLFIGCVVAEPQFQPNRTPSFQPKSPSFPPPQQPNNRPQPGDRGSWSVGVNQNKGFGPQVRTEAQGRIYTSPKGNFQVNGQGYHEFGKGRKPDYGVGVTATGRFRRNAYPEEDVVLAENFEEVLRERRSPDDNRRGSVNVDLSHDRQRGPQIRTEVRKPFYTSPNRNFEVNGYGYHEAGRGRKPDYGVGIRATGRFRRDAEFEEVYEIDPTDEITREKRFAFGQGSNPNVGGQGDRGSWGVSVNKDKGRGPQIRTEAQGNIYKGDRVRVDAQGHHEAGKGRKPDYGGGVKVSGKWRRDISEINDASDVNEDVLDRQIRSPRRIRIRLPSNVQLNAGLNLGRLTATAAFTG